MRLRVLLLSDGLPGHYRQSEAILAALARHREVSAERIELRRPWWIPGRLARSAVGRMHPAALLERIYRVSPKGLAADLVVSAGSSTLPANAALSACLGVPNVFAGSARGIGADKIALVLLPYRSAAQNPGTLFALKPAMIDPDRLPPLGPWTGPAEAAGAAFSLLVGGPTREVAFAEPDWARLVALVGRLAADWGVGWRIATSRRTPQPAYAALEALAAETQGVELLDYRRAGPGSIDPAFHAGTVFVTSDSLSMITEAVAARRRVVALAPETVRPSRDGEAIADLARDRRLALLPLAAATPTAVDQALRAVVPMTENHLDALAEALLTRLSL